MEHTKEPWKISKISSTAIDGSKGFVVATCGGYQDNTLDSEDLLRELEANARRIVACVNACAAFPTKVLEDGAASIFEYSIELMKQRDELLAALKVLFEVAKASFNADKGGSNMFGYEESALRQAESAIAEVEQS